MIRAHGPIIGPASTTVEGARCVDLADGCWIGAGCALCDGSVATYVEVNGERLARLGPNDELACIRHRPLPKVVGEGLPAGGILEYVRHSADGERYNTADEQEKQQHHPKVAL